MLNFKLLKWNFNNLKFKTTRILVVFIVAGLDPNTVPFFTFYFALFCPQTETAAPICSPTSLISPPDISQTQMRVSFPLFVISLLEPEACSGPSSFFIIQSSYSCSEE